MSVNAEVVATVAFCVSTASVAWSAAYAWARWLARPRDTVLAVPEYQEYLGRRIGDLERTVALIGESLERLSETQQLTARLLAERLPATSRLPRDAGAHPRIDTPH